jgi:hypothetical protein
VKRRDREEGVGPFPGKATVKIDRLLGGGKRLLPPAEGAEHPAQIGKAPGEVGEEGVGPFLGKAASDDAASSLAASAASSRPRALSLMPRC